MPLNAGTHLKLNRRNMQQETNSTDQEPNTEAERQSDTARQTDTAATEDSDDGDSKEVDKAA